MTGTFTFFSLQTKWFILIIFWNFLVQHNSKHFHFGSIFVSELGHEMSLVYSNWMEQPSVMAHQKIVNHQSWFKTAKIRSNNSIWATSYHWLKWLWVTIIFLRYIILSPTPHRYCWWCRWRLCHPHRFEILIELKAEPKWTKKIAGNTVPKSFFKQSDNLWRPGIYKEPSDGCNATIPVFIKTSADNYEFREILRKNFLRQEFKGQTLAQYFVLGKTTNLSDPKFLKIQEEAEKYNDIIIGNFSNEFKSWLSGRSCPDAGNKIFATKHWKGPKVISLILTII